MIEKSTITTGLWLVCNRQVKKKGKKGKKKTYKGHFSYQKPIAQKIMKTLQARYPEREWWIEEEVADENKKNEE